MKFQVVIKEDLEGGGYIVHCPALKGCWSQGGTIEEVLDNIKKSIVGYLKTLNERAMYGIKILYKALVREVAVI
jgi:predicted RNase H-like HicB family nuclease